MREKLGPLVRINVAEVTIGTHLKILCVSEGLWDPCSIGAGKHPTTTACEQGNVEYSEITWLK